LGLVRRVPMRALAEDRPTDPDERRALLDGDLEVIGPPHRELGTERRASRAQLLRDHAPAGGAPAERSSSEIPRRWANVGRAASGSATMRPIVIRPRTSRASRPAIASSAPWSWPGANPAFDGSLSTLTCRSTAERLGGSAASRPPC